MKFFQKMSFVSFLMGSVLFSGVSQAHRAIENEQIVKAYDKFNDTQRQSIIAILDAKAKELEEKIKKEIDGLKKQMISVKTIIETKHTSDSALDKKAREIYRKIFREIRDFREKNKALKVPRLFDVLTESLRTFLVEMEKVGAKRNSLLGVYKAKMDAIQYDAIEILSGSFRGTFF